MGYFTWIHSTTNMYLILTKGKLKHTMGKGPYFMLQSPHAPCGNNTNCYEKKFKYLTTD